MATRIMYDRVIITINGQEYLPNGEIRNFEASARASSRQAQGMTKTGLSAGIVYGNAEADVRWTEYLPTATNTLNWMTFLLANPNATLEVKPYSIGNAEEAEISIITGMACTNLGKVAGGEGDPVTRPVSFTAQQCTGLTYD